MKNKRMDRKRLKEERKKECKINTQRNGKNEWSKKERMREITNVKERRRGMEKMNEARKKELEK